MNSYQELRDRHQRQANEFPMAFAFNDKQFEEAMDSLGLKADDYDKVYSIGAGGIIRKDDCNAFNDMLKGFKDELQSEIDKDTSGEEFIYDMFRYELANHEYGYTYSLDSTLDSIGISLDEINESEALKHGLELAKKDYLDSFEG